MIALLAFLVGTGLGVGVGIRIGDRARATYREIADWSGQRLDAYRLADHRTDLDQVGPVTGEHKAADQ